MWRWLSVVLRSQLGRRILLTIAGLWVRRRLADVQNALLTDAEEYEDDDDDGRRIWPLLVLVGGGVVGWLIYRANQRDDDLAAVWEAATPGAESVTTATTAQPAVPEPDVVGDDEAAFSTDVTDDDVAAAADVLDDEASAAPASDDGPDLAAGEAVLGRSLAVDDLKVVDGIGPKIEQLLNEHGIVTWHDLAAAEGDQLRDILGEAGSRYHMHDPSDWPNQAALLAQGQWAQFDERTPDTDGDDDL